MDKAYEEFLKIRKASGLKFYDTHTHPLDVLGVTDVESLTKEESREVSSLKPSLLETMKYGDTVLLLLDFLFRKTPWYIKKTIRDSYKGVDKEFFISMLNQAGIDKAVLLPVSPFKSPAVLYEDFFNDDRFINLGSVDIHSIEERNIENELYNQVTQYNIKGVKLHPNFQRFYPHPYQNDEATGRKLTILYNALNKYRLYALFHGGSSYAPNKSGTFDKVDYASIENFSSKESSADDNLFRIIKMPIIIAHLGNYNVRSPRIDKLNSILSTHDNVFVDTAAVSPKLIHNFISNYGVTRVVFGSDTIYFNLQYNIQLILDILKKTSTDRTFEEKVIDIFSKNYTEKILNPC